MQQRTGTGTQRPAAAARADTQRRKRQATPSTRKGECVRAARASFSLVRLSSPVVGGREGGCSACHTTSGEQGRKDSAQSLCSRSLDRPSRAFVRFVVACTSRPAFRRASWLLLRSRGWIDCSACHKVREGSLKKSREVDANQAKPSPCGRRGKRFGR